MISYLLFSVTTIDGDFLNYLWLIKLNTAYLKNMFVARSIGVEHKDLIQDVAYDSHGKRMATCSCDQFVKVFLHHC